VSARVQEYALAITGGNHHVTLKDLTLFATTVHAYGVGSSASLDVHHVTIDTLTFRHPSAMKRLLGDNQHSWPTALARDAAVGTVGNFVIYNSTFTGAEGHPMICAWRALDPPTSRCRPHCDAMVCRCHGMPSLPARC
jgi:hypothetical protein